MIETEREASDINKDREKTWLGVGKEKLLGM
jgi:hypothetical protein